MWAWALNEYIRIIGPLNEPGRKVTQGVSAVEDLDDELPVVALGAVFVFALECAHPILDTSFHLHLRTDAVEVVPCGLHVTLEGAALRELETDTVDEVIEVGA